MTDHKIFIQDFTNGIITDKTKQTDNGFNDVVGLDLYSEDGVLSMNRKPVADTVNGTPDNILSFIKWDDFLIAGMEDEKLYYNDVGTTWNLLNTNANTGDNNDIITYNNFLFYASRTALGRSTTTAVGGGFTDTYQFFDNGGSQDLHFFKIFNNRLYISDGNVLAELDGTSDITDPTLWVFTANKFVLPAEENIKSLEVIGSELAIGTSSGIVYFWDGASDNASVIVEADIGEISALINVDNTLWTFAGISGGVYVYNGSNFDLVYQIPNFNIQSVASVRQRGVDRYKNGIIFLCRGNGIYNLNRINDTVGYSLTKYGDTTDGNPNTGTSMRAIYVYNKDTTNDDFVLGWSNNIDRFNGSGGFYIDSDDCYIETVVYNIRSKQGKPTRIIGTQVDFADENGNNKVEVEYKLNTETSYNNLGIIGSGGIDLDEILRGIDQVGNKIQMRYNLGSTTSINNTRITGIRIY